MAQSAASMLNVKLVTTLAASLLSLRASRNAMLYPLIAMERATPTNRTCNPYPVPSKVRKRLFEVEQELAYLLMLGKPTPATLTTELITLYAAIVPHTAWKLGRGWSRVPSDVMPIHGQPYYAIHPDGTIYSLTAGSPKSVTNNDVMLEKISFYVPKLVAETFVPNPRAWKHVRLLDPTQPPTATNVVWTPNGPRTLAAMQRRSEAAQAKNLDLDQDQAARKRSRAKAKEIHRAYKQRIKDEKAQERARQKAHADFLRNLR